MRIVFALASALAASVALLLPAPAGADHDNTCHPTSGRTNAGEGVFWMDIEDPALTGALGLSIAADFPTRVFGAINVGRGVLLPQADGSSAQCADANGNGDAGLILAQIALESVRTGRPALAVLRPGEGDDIDATGVYPGTLEICVGSECTRSDVEIRAVVTWFR